MIVEDHRLFADVVRSALEADGIDVIGVAGDGATAITLVQREVPEIVLIDLGLPDRGGLSVGQEILDDHPDLAVVALSAIDDPRMMAEARRVGFRAYLTKDASVTKLVRTVQAVMRGETVMPYVTTFPRSEREAAPSFLATQLTPREREVLELLARGESGASMAKILGISANTVRTHVQSILTKLQAHSRLEAVAVAVRHSLIELPGAAAGGPRLSA